MIFVNVLILPLVKIRITLIYSDYTLISLECNLQKLKHFFAKILMTIVNSFLFYEENNFQ